MSGYKNLDRFNKIIPIFLIVITNSIFQTTAQIHHSTTHNPTLPNTLHTFDTNHRGKIQSFSLADVQIHPDTDFAIGAALNHEYLLLLDPDNLLYNFRTTAGLPAPGQSYGGWEGPSVEVRGQFIGHYLSALAFAYKNTHNPIFLDRSTLLINGLAECQSAFGNGYLSAFPISHFDRLESLQPVWAPYYVIHKIMAGLLDQHKLTHHPNALSMLLGMANYFCSRSHAAIAKYGRQHWQKILDVEFGGMNEIYYHVFGETGDPSWNECGDLFIKDAWFVPLVKGEEDVLPDLHANTHLAQVNGFAARYDATGDPLSAHAVVNFFHLVVSHHSYSTGGSSWYEHWGAPRALGTVINETGSAANTQESCTTYNILKIARSLFRWTGKAYYADFYERALLNGVLGIQRISHSHHYHQNHNYHHNHEEEEEGYHNEDIFIGVDEMHARSLSMLKRTQQQPALFAVPSSSSPGSNPASMMNEDEVMNIAATNALHEKLNRPENYKIVSWPDDPAIYTNTTTTKERGDTTPMTNPYGPGQYIYYMPLGHEGGKGQNPKAWTQGWGDRFNTFWCCYGTAIESFSKFADSIYFWKEGHQKESEDNKESDTQTVIDLGRHHNNNNNKCGHIPELYINQLVSSTLKWHQYNINIEQRAELFSAVDNVARSTIQITSIDNDDYDDDEKNKNNTIMMYIHWRVPSWVKESDNLSENGQRRKHVDLKLNGRPFDPEAMPLSFGNNSEFIVLGPYFKHGDLLEIEMTMKIVLENINDDDKAMKSLKAIVMGPFHMAGITHDGDRVIDIEEDGDIENQVAFLNENRGFKASDYPKGSRVLYGKTKKYVIAPLGQIIDEHYTAYFEFV